MYTQYYNTCTYYIDIFQFQHYRNSLFFYSSIINIIFFKKEILKGTIIMIIYCIVQLSPFYCKMNVLPLGQTIIFLLLNSFLLFFLSCFLWALICYGIEWMKEFFSPSPVNNVSISTTTCYSVSSLKDRSHNFITPVDNVLNQVSMMCLTLIKCLVVPLLMTWPTLYLSADRFLNYVLTPMLTFVLPVPGWWRDLLLFEY